MNLRNGVFAALLALTQLPSLALAEVTLPSIFTDHSVLQRDKPIRVWGWAAPGKQVSVAIDSATKSGRAGKDGKWQLDLPALKAGGPHTLRATEADGNSVTVKDIYIGEVWLCSGQSNMAMTVSRAARPEEEAAAANLPLIRMFKVASGPSPKLADRCQGSWVVCRSDVVGGFSATAYFFGKQLHKELRVPIGLINSSVGGTSIESWTSMSAQNAVPAIEPRLAAWREADNAFDAAKAKSTYDTALARWQTRSKQLKAEGKRAPRRPALAAQPRLDRNYPSNLYNGKIHPIVGYTIRGAIWYQGENSSGRGFAHLYQAQLETLVRDWRQRWGYEFPFAWVQLPNFKTPQKAPSETSGWVLVREGMLRALAEPKTGMAVTVDIGEEKDIHPKNKQDVGSRLATWALVTVYDKSGDAMGPLAKKTTFANGKALVEFEHANGLHSADQPIEGFAIAGKDKVFHWAEAKVDGNRVVVSSKDVPNPVSVRYAWAANPHGNLRNKTGIPASPFRSDDWDETANQ